MSDAPRDDLRDLAAGYTLGALSPEEARAFETALAGSPELRREVAEFREVNALLGAAETRAPADDLKQRLRERIRAGKVAPLPGPPAPGRRSGAAIGLGIGMAASLLLAAGLYRQTRALNEALAEREQRLAAREATLNALLEPAVQLTTLTATGEAPPVVQVFWNRANHSLVVHTFRLKPAPAGRAYQLWLLPKDGKPIASAVFDTEPGGHQLVQNISVPPDQPISGFALTVEPAGGSPQPTTTPIVFGNAGS